jgi:hypothetical protein
VYSKILKNAGPSHDRVICEPLMKTVLLLDLFCNKIVSPKKLKNSSLLPIAAAKKKAAC